MVAHGQSSLCELQWIPGSTCDSTFLKTTHISLYEMKVVAQPLTFQSALKNAPAFTCINKKSENDSIQNISVPEVTDKQVQLKQVDVFEVSDHDIYMKDEVQRYPASFADPGRLALFSAGTFSVDDQANHVSVRGNHPFQNKWFIEGLEVLNPNHLENAGTFSDRPGATGGGVNIFSTLVMHHSRFMKGVMPVQYDNVTGGVFDISLRNGSTESRHHSVQASLLGMELSTEGPMISDNASYLVHFRYSTVGLLSLAGINFGNEKINYYDGTMILNWTTEKVRLKAFLIGGKSANDHNRLSDTSEATSYKDFQDIFYSSNTGIAGLSVSGNAGKRTVLSASIAGSHKMNSRIEAGIFSGNENEKASSEMLSYRGEAKIFFGKSTLKYGLAGSIENNLLGNQIRFVPFISHELFNGRFSLEPGASFMIIKDRIFPDPRIGAAIRLSQAHSISLRTGRKTQNLVDNTFKEYSGILNSNDIELIHHYTGRSHRLKATLFHQKVRSDHPELHGSLFSLVSRGIEIVGEKEFRNTTVLISAALFDVNDSLSVFENSIHDYGAGVNLYVGRTLHVTQEKLVNFDLRINYHAGGYQLKIDPIASYFSSETVFEKGLNRLPAYYRADFRISYVRTSKNTGLLFLDIQNMLNIKNISGYYYDPFLKKVIAREQLGIIPVLGYRIDF